MNHRVLKSSWISLLGLVALFFGLLAAAPVASAAVSSPQGLAPADGASVSTYTPTFSWSRVSGASRYELWVDDNADFTSPQKVTTVNRRWVPTAALPDGTAYWRVRAEGSDRKWGSWTDAQFRIEKQDGPTPAAPVDGQLLSQPENPPLLTWNSLQGALEYEVQVDRDDNFLTAKTYTTYTTSLVVPDQVADGAYSWRVRARLGSGIYSAYSAIQHYTIGPLAQVTGATPNDANVHHEDVVLEWDPVDGAAEYELWVSTDPDFNDTTRTVLKDTIVSTRYSPPTTFLNDQYYWKVRAVNARGEYIDWTDLRVPRQIFRRDWQPAPKLVYPPNNAQVGDDFYFEWTPVRLASHYELNVGTDPNFSPNTYEVCTTAGTTYTAGHPGDRCMPSQGATYYWRVRGIDGPKNVVGIYSKESDGLYTTPRKFIYDSGPVVLTSPAPGAEVAVPTLQWEAHREAEKYRVIITGTGGGNRSIDTYSLSVTPNLDPKYSPYTWTVQAVDNNNKISPRYPGRSFTLVGTPPSTGQQPLTPLSGLVSDPPTSRFPLLTWEPYDGAAYYKVTIGTAGSGYRDDPSKDSLLREELTYPAATSTDDSYLSPGTYEWEVAAYGTNDVRLATGPTARFTIRDLGGVTGQKIALTGSALDAGNGCRLALDTNAQDDSDQCKNVPATPVLDWEPVSGAAYYMVYLSQDPNLTNLVYPPTKIPTTVNTRWTPTFQHNPKVLPDSEAGKAYYWHIRPCKANGICNPDPVSVINSATNAFAKVSPKPKLLSATTANDVTFTWEDYLATNTVTPYSVTAEPSHQTAMKYRIEVSTQSNFSSLVDSREVDQTTYTAFDKRYPEGDLYWRVQAIDANNNNLAWSATEKLTKSSPVPTLIGPKDGAQTSGLTALRWNPTPYAKQYRVQVYKNNDKTYSPANKVFEVVTTQTAYAHDEPLPPSTEPYLWRVQRIDAKGLNGVWSGDCGDIAPSACTPTGRFISKGSSPPLSAPAPGSLISGNDAFFAWSAVPDAVKYTLEYRREGTTSVSTINTAALAAAPTSTLSDGSYEWRVTAYGARNALLGTSEWRRFMVDGTAPTIVKNLPTGTMKKKANFKVVFSEPVRNVSTKTIKLKMKGKRKPIATVVKLKAGGTKAVVNPKKNLKRGKTYIVQVKPKIQDHSGLYLAKGLKWKVKVR